MVQLGPKCIGRLSQKEDISELIPSIPTNIFPF